MRGKLMRLCTKEQHIRILTQFQDDDKAAKEYQRVTGHVVLRQNVRYWRNIFLVNEGNLSATDNALKQDRKLRVPAPTDDVGQFVPDLSATYHSILVIPDQHFPYHHKDLFAFLAAVYAAFRPDLVVNLGDETDHHALSFHDSDPNLDSAGVELEKAKRGLNRLHNLFPKQLVCDSNHGSMAFRKAKHHGIPVQYIKKYREVLFPEHGAPGWSWADYWIVQTPLGEVMFKHQSSNILADAAHNRCNLMVGHSHSKFSVEYCASRDYLYWGAYSGCLIDNESYAYAYGKHSKDKPIIGCTVILEGRPVLVPMILNNEGRWVGKL